MITDFRELGSPLLTETDWLSISLGVIAVIVASVAVVLELYHSHEIKEHNLAEKNAMLWGYVRQVSNYSIIPPWLFNKIVSDIVATEALRSEIKGYRAKMLWDASHALLQAMQGRASATQLAMLREHFQNLFPYPV